MKRYVSVWLPELEQATHQIAMLPPPARKRQRYAIAKLVRWAGRYGHNRFADGQDGFWVEISNSTHRFAGEAALLDDLAGCLDLMGIPARIAAADTQGAARALARCATHAETSWIAAPTGAGIDAIGFLPARCLAVSADAAAALLRLGLRSIADVASFPQSILARRLAGKDIAAEIIAHLDEMTGQSLGPEKLAAENPVLSVGCRIDVSPAPPEHFERVIEKLTYELVRKLGEQARVALTLRLSMYFRDGKVVSVRVSHRSGYRNSSAATDGLAAKFQGLDAILAADVVALEALRTRRQKLQQFGFAESPSFPASSWLQGLPKHIQTERFTERSAVLVRPISMPCGQPLV